MADAVTKQVLRTRSVSDHVLERLFEVHPFQARVAREQALTQLRTELKVLTAAAEVAIDEINYELDEDE